MDPMDTAKFLIREMHIVNDKIFISVEEKEAIL